MNLLIKLTIFLTLLVSKSHVHAQYKEKDTLYFKFELNDGFKASNLGVKMRNERLNGIIFNDMDKGRFVFSDKDRADTLPLASLKHFKLSSTRDIEALEKDWWRRNEEKLREYYGGSYPPIDRNGMFVTYLIEEIDNECIVVYPVTWRDTGARN